MKIPLCVFYRGFREKESQTQFLRSFVEECQQITIVWDQNLISKAAEYLRHKNNPRSLCSNALLTEPSCPHILLPLRKVGRVGWFPRFYLERKSISFSPSSPCQSAHSKEHLHPTATPVPFCAPAAIKINELPWMGKLHLLSEEPCSPHVHKDSCTVMLCSELLTRIIMQTFCIQSQSVNVPTRAVKTSWAGLFFFFFLPELLPCFAHSQFLRQY